MKKQLIILVASICILTATLSGCQQSNSTIVTQNDKVLLQSDIVELSTVNFSKTLDKEGKITSVTVKWLFHNIAERLINADILVQFSDTNGNIIFSDTRELLNVPAGYTERYISPGANTVMYDGKDAGSIDHVIITVTEKIMP